MVASLDLKEVISRVLTNSARYVGAERGMLVALDEKMAPEMAAVLYQGRLKPTSKDDLDDILRAGLAGWVVREQKIALIPDTSQDARWLRRADDDITKSGAKSAVCAPIRVIGERLVGVITLVHPEPGFMNTRHAALLEAVADQAAIAIHNAQQYQSLETTRLRYHQLFEDNIDPILISSWNGWIVEANHMAAQVSGYGINQITRRRITELHRPDWDALGEDFSLLWSGSHTISYESELQCCEEGRTIPIQVYAQKVVFDGDDRIQWVLRDISERKELETLQNELLAMIYHDLRSPLSNVVSSLDMIKSMLPDEMAENLTPLVDIAMRSTDRVKRLADSLLDTNRLEVGQRIVEKKEVRLQRLVEEAVEAVQLNADARKQSLELNLPTAMPSIHVDEDMIRRVLINLLDNAIKFTPTHGSINLGGYYSGGTITFWVEDTGDGIPPEARERIFDKFARLDIENAPRGIGLGLAFCRLAVEAHGGHISVEPNRPQGSRFIVTLPVEVV